MEAHAERAECYAKGCSEPPTAICDRCGRPFCSAHLGQIVIQRREERSAQATHLGALTRLPTRPETYALCSPCRAKPVPHKPLPFTL